MTQSHSYNRAFPLVTAKEIYEHKLVGHRYFVELASKQVQRQDDRAVPASTKVIDVVVTQPTEDAIAQLVSACGWLKGYEVVSYNEPKLDYAPF